MYYSRVKKNLKCGVYLLEVNTALKSTTVTFASLTYANKAKRMLQKRGIDCQIVRLNGRNSLHGCTFGIEIPDAEFYNAILLLKNEQIYYGVYRRDEK